MSDTSEKLRLAAIDDQIDDLREGCIKLRCVPLVLFAIDEDKRGHILWPDDVPDELVEATPMLLLDALAAFRERPIKVSELEFHERSND